jgi:hypothetical protein
MKTILSANVTGSLLLVVMLSAYSFTCFSQDKENSVHIGLVYPLSTHGTSAREYSNVFSLHAIAGVSREETGFTASGFSNIIKGNAYGFQMAGFSNHVGGYAEGFLGAGFLNMYKSANGFQYSGFANLATGDVTGAQVSGFMNIAGDMHGFQGAGFFNKGRRVHGVQYGGFINIADDVKGAQLAGFINIAKKVKGVQFAGFINIADSSDYPIGIINLIKHGEKSIGISTDDNLTTLLSFRSGGRKLYGIIGIGYNFENSKEVFAVQTGFGAHVVSTRHFRLNTEATFVYLENFKKGEFEKYSLSILPAIKLTPRLEVFAGPSFNYVDTNSTEGKSLVDHYTWHDTNNEGQLRGIYVGYTGGVHWIL